MKANSLFWKGSVPGNRTEVISKLILISGRYGMVLNSKSYSDLDISLVLEVESVKLQELQSELSGFAAMDYGQDIPSHQKHDVLVHINLSFYTGTGDIEHDVACISE